jgi:hypothetical protein
MNSKEFLVYLLRSRFSMVIYERIWSCCLSLDILFICGLIKVSDLLIFVSTWIIIILIKEKYLSLELKDFSSRSNKYLSNLKSKTHLSK